MSVRERVERQRDLIKARDINNNEEEQHLEKVLFKKKDQLEQT